MERLLIPTARATLLKQHRHKRNGLIKDRIKVILLRWMMAGAMPQ